MERLRTCGFETILVLHLLLLPFDLVSALDGCLSVRYRALALATLPGWIPGSIVFTMPGQTRDQHVTDDSVLVTIKPWMFILMTVVLVVRRWGIVHDEESSGAA